jgi:Dna[CI] antecedent, DciA
MRSEGTVRRRLPLQPLGAAADRALSRVAHSVSGFSWVAARWPELVGSHLASRVVPESLEAGTLRLRVLEPTWRRAVEAMLPEIERRVAAEIGGSRLRVELTSH